jgi:UDP-N-acetylglucosamine 3-dehydrogenase
VAVTGRSLGGRTHVRVYEELDKPSLVEVCNIDGSVASEVGRKLHVDGYDDPSELLEREDIEAVSVCTPTKTHRKVSAEVREKGKHLLVEKHMTDTMTDTEKLLQMSERAGLNLAVRFVERFNPAILEAKKLIERG